MKLILGALYIPTKYKKVILMTSYQRGFFKDRIDLIPTHYTLGVF